MNGSARTIWKFPFPVQDEITIEMPTHAEILHVGTQNDVPAIWALVDPDRVVEERKFTLYGTGHALPDYATTGGIDGMHHVGSFQMFAGALVFHMFAGAKDT